MHADYFIFWYPHRKARRLKKYWKQKGKKNPDLSRPGDVVISGLEPPTHGFSVRCSTN